MTPTQSNRLHSTATRLIFTARVWAVVTVMFAAACSPLDLINGSVAPEAVVTDTDIPYGPRQPLRLDVHAPAAPADEPRKVVVFFYGGRWESGSKSDYLFVAEALSRFGVMTVIPDLRMYPEVRYPVFVDDAARAVRWVRENISRYGGDPDSIYLVGHSSGAHIAAMLNLDESRLDPAGIRGTVGLAGPYDFLPFYSDGLADIFSDTDDPADTQPINYVDGDEPPMLLISGGDDHTVDPGNTRRLAARIHERGGDVQTIFYPDIGHYMIIGAIARPLNSFAPTLRDMAAFIAPNAAPDE